MRKRRALRVMGLGFCSAISTVDVASAQMLPQSKPETRAAIIAYRKGLN